MDVLGLRVWISGATGFVGAALARAAVQHGARVSCGVRPGSDPWRLRDVAADVRTVACDLVDAASVATAMSTVRPDLVFHCAAARWHPDRMPTHDDQFAASVIGTFHLCEALLRHPPRTIVHVSTIQEGAPAAGLEAVPRTFRGAVKQCGSILLGQLAREHGIGLVTLRVASAYGPRQQRDRVVPTLIRSALDGTPPTIVAAGTGRDFVYIDDVVDAALRAAGAEAASGASLAIGSGRVTPIRALAELVYAACGVTLGASRPFPVRPYDQAFTAVSPGEATRVLGWEAQTGLEAGIARTVAWMRSQPDGS